MYNMLNHDDPPWTTKCEGEKWVCNLEDAISNATGRRYQVHGYIEWIKRHCNWSQETMEIHRFITRQLAREKNNRKCYCKNIFRNNYYPREILFGCLAFDETVLKNEILST